MSHDYLHCQDGNVAPQRHGSLIISEFTGSASIFQGHELLVNPWDYTEVAETINRALEMSSAQKQRNWEYLLKKKTPFTAIAWYHAFQGALTTARSTQLSREVHQISPLSTVDLKDAYDKSNYRLLFFEESAVTSSNTGQLTTNSTSMIKNLLLDPFNLIYVTSDKSPEQLELALQGLSTRVGYIAENGCFKRDVGSTYWKTLVDLEKAKDWRNGIRKVLQYYQERTEGSQFEERRCLLKFWYNEAPDPEVATRQVSELADQVNGSRGSEAIRVVLTEGVLTVEPLDVTKAKAAASILESLPRLPDFLFVVGGSRSDEALFRWANNKSSSGDKIHSVTSLAVGAHATEAKAVLPDNMTLAAVVNALAPQHPDGDGPIS